jgi:hypothetical protein
MAIVGLSSASTRKVELSSDPAKGTPEATRFIIGSLSAREMAGIKDKSSKFDSKGNFSNEGNKAALEVVRLGLKGWENFLDADGKEIAFLTEEVSNINKKTTVAAYASLDRLSFTDLLEIHNHIAGLNTLTEEERKN